MELLIPMLLLVLKCTTASLNADYFYAPEILEENRHPQSFSTLSGDFVTVGHFRGVLKQGVKPVCNGITCYTMPRFKFVSRGWADVFVSVYNASRALQWTRTAGGNGDDKARAVCNNMDGNIMITGYITGLNAQFSGLTLSARTAMSRTIFVASYSPTGAILFVKEAASCGIGKCDVTSIASDDTGTVLTGKFLGRISFGVKEQCTDTNPRQCLPIERGYLDETSLPTNAFAGKQKSTGSGVVFTEYCWVAKYDSKGDYLWHKYCHDKSFETDRGHLIEDRTNTYEQVIWSQKAQKFFALNPKDSTGLLGKEVNYEEYASRRVPYGF